ncbi:hypothetical protein OG689_35770 [Kitasatospora sp. NBC_00240]|uniref:hypothetical protein n=1 Tax=Kitasatospora sp. NBC_00240 TaxID=2903567 RepID=UPI002252AAEA|nr:hypothetical protein [Kitasatospora sp. NBC_00240]MCX5214559.1 hypothetical protein [Kitasatospora sp. NBC_00240]
MCTGTAKAAVARRAVRYLHRGDTGGLGPDADGDVVRMLLSGSVAPGVTGEPEEQWLALRLYLCRCTAPALPAGPNGTDLRESSRSVRNGGGGRGLLDGGAAHDRTMPGCAAVAAV